MSRRDLLALVAGTLFGFGLSLSQMVNPAKVLAFLDLAGAWDPSLGFVMLGAVAVTFAAFPAVLRRSRPVLAETFALPTKREIDVRLISGADLPTALHRASVAGGLACLTVGAQPSLPDRAAIDRRLADLPPPVRM